MRVAVTGAGGRLGRAVVSALEEAPFTGPFGPIAWSRAIFDLDTPEGVGPILDRDRPEMVVHCAAWTDVDGCARDPELALARNGEATGVLARAAAERGIDLIVISTNEIFDGRRTDGAGYAPADEPDPINGYGASKLAGEVAARAAYEGVRGAVLGIARTAWLYGPPGNDFPAKILAAADRAAALREPLRLVADEVGSPSYTLDVAEAITELIGSAAVGGTHHLVNAGRASRADWAREVLRQARIDIPTDDVPASTWPRASTPPAWAVLEPTPLPGGEPLRSWQSALADYLPTLLRQRSAAGSVAR
ncbi:MAG: NAD(P)-dependent oxidoreductase [Chloroflexi bacterium]|nr:NAD(P)-dependent oxidoreductase [Chloroflexota bacterium]